MSSARHASCPLDAACSRPTPSFPATHFPQRRASRWSRSFAWIEGAGDAEALATWHQALSNALTADVPHDLLALWLYPERAAGAVLLGPEALAQDDLSVPLPSPQLQPEQLAILEEIVRDAGYRVGGLASRSASAGGTSDSCCWRASRPAAIAAWISWCCVSPRSGSRLRSGGSRDSGAARGSRAGDGSPRCSTASRRRRAAGTTPQRFAPALSHALEPLIPHDRLELIARGTGRRALLPAGRAPRRAALGRSIARARRRRRSISSGLTDSHGRVLLGDAGRERALAPRLLHRARPFRAPSSAP